MAGGAYVVSASMAGWEWRVLGVIESRSRPGSRGVASLARSREELGLRLVARVRGRVRPGRLLARPSVHWRGGTVCEPVSGNVVLAWLKVESVQTVVS